MAFRAPHQMRRRLQLRGLNSDFEDGAMCVVENNHGTIFGAHAEITQHLACCSNGRDNRILIGIEIDTYVVLLVSDTEEEPAHDQLLIGTQRLH
jgi:hypothetical protein